MELTSSIILVILAVAAQEESFSMLDSLECWQFRIPGLFKRPIKQIAVLSVNPDTAWTKEVNLVSWNGKDTQYDIREWSPDHDETGEGITLTNEEMEELKNIKE